MTRFVILLLATMPAGAGLLSVTIQDEKGASVAGRVYLTDAAGRPVFPKDTIVYDKTRPDGNSERHFVPRGGRFTVELAAGTYDLVVERGKEYLPEHASVAIPASGKVARTILLRRWIDMAARGWFSGDMHVHRPLAALATLMEAEDLSVAVPLTRWRRTAPDVSEDPDLPSFLARADEDGVFHAGAHRFFPVLNEELEPRNAALLASWLSRQAVALEYPLAAFGEAVQRAGGVSDSEKATSLEVPVLAALGACQTVGLANNHLWRTGSFPGPWGAWPKGMLGEYPQTCRGFVQAGFDMYSALLDAGFPIKLSAGSASGVHPVPPGWSRIYVRTGRPLTPRAWFEGLRAGRSFVTSGPMLFLSVNGKQPGDELRGRSFPLPLDISVEMDSLTPVASAEVVINGTAHVVPLAAAPGKPHTWQGSVKLAAKSSSWIAARWSAERGNSCDAAHTAPVYVRDGDAPIAASRQELQQLLARVNSLIEQATGGESGTVMTPAAVREQTLEDFRKAAEVYRRKLASAPAHRE